MYHKNYFLSLIIFGLMSLSVKAQLAFLPKTDYITTPNPVSIVKADFNNDGNVDLATMGLTGAISILLGNGDGAFSPAPAIGLGAAIVPNTMIVADLNNDGKTDLLAAVENNSAIALVFGNGDGTFQAVVNVVAGNNPTSIAAADFNGDGILDFATANSLSNNLSILLGNGNGTSYAYVQAVAGSNPRSIVAADFNSDGKMDLLAGSVLSGQISLALGNGNGTFQPGTLISTAGDPQDMTIGDVNVDGKTDVIVLNPNSATFTVLLGNGNGTFIKTDFPTGMVLPGAIEMGDFNADGKPDLSITSGNVTIAFFLGNGDGTFRPKIDFAINSTPGSHAVGQFNGDGLPDVAVANTNHTNISVIINTIAPDANGILYVKKGASGNGASWAGALGEVAKALKVAQDINATNPGKVKQIWVASGTYVPLYDAADGRRDQDAGRQNSFVLVKDVQLYGGFSGTETSLTGRSWVVNKTILSGELQNDANMANNAYHVVISSGDAGAGLIDGFTISEGSPIEDFGVSIATVNGNDVINRICGGLYNYASSLLVKNCVFSKNTGQSGIAFYNIGGNPVLMNVLMYGNYNLKYSGVSFVSISGNPSLINTTIAGNTSSYPVAVAAGNAKMYNSIVFGNTNFAAFTFENIDIKNSIVQGYTGGTGNLDADPLFNNAASGDFTVKLGSPAINKGGNALYELADLDPANNSLSTDKDLAGGIRFLGSSIDIGAYERIAPDLLSATYDVATHVLKVTGTNFEANPGALNDVNVNALTLSGQGGQTYTLTSANVELSNATSFSVVLNAADQHGLDNILDKNGLASTDGTTYNLAAADGWLAAVTYNADLTENGILVSGNRAPTTVNDNINVVTNIPVNGNVLTNDSDPEGDRLTASLVTAPVNGTVVLNADGSFTYTPNADFIGKDSLRYQVCDNGTPSLCDSAWVYYDVKPIAPIVTSVSVPANGYYKSGDLLIFTADFSENVTVNTTGGTPFLSLTIGAQSRQAAYVGGSGSNALTFSHTVQPGDVDLNGIVLGTALTINGSIIQNSAAKNALPALNNVGNTSGVFVYSAVPTVVLSSTAPALLNQPFTVTAAFSEAVTGFTVADLTITNATAGNLQTSDNITYTLLVTPSADGMVSISLPAGKVVNIAGSGNTASNTLSFTYDGTAPAAPVVLTVPNGATILTSTAAISGTAEANSTVTVYLDAQLVNAAVTVDAAGNWTYTSAVLSDGLHTVNAKAKDAVGNESPVSNTNTFRVNTAPTISASGIVNALTTTYGTVSSSAQFTVSGTNMTSGILITAPAGFELSTNNINFSNAVTAGASGTISGTVYLRLKSTANAGSYSGNIVLRSPGATAVNLATAVSTVNKALLTIKANDEEKFAGTANPVFSAGYTGFVNGETAAVLSVQAAFTTTATTESLVGIYDIEVSGASAVNYNISYVKGTLTVKPGAPTDISLAAVTLYENSTSGTPAGTLSSTSGDPSATFSYTLVSGTGDTDNALFAISGNKINTASGLNYENKQVYRVRVRSTTPHNLWLEKELSININDVNEAPALAAIVNQPICYTTTAQVVALNGISAGPESGQTTTLNISSSNPGLFESLAAVGTGATGSVNYRVKNGASGTATVTVTVQDNGGTANGGIDIYSQTFVVTVNPLPVLAISSDKGLTISKGETVQITASGAATYLWMADGSILNGLNNAFIAVRPMKTTTYTVTATNASGCTQTQSFTLTVLDDYVKLKANNILTPNNDGYNDKWVVENIDVYPDNEVKVFDKAGRMIYTKKGYDNSWDGTLNGTALNEDTYYYIIDFGKNGRKFRGYITLIRESK